LAVRLELKQGAMRAIGSDQIREQEMEPAVRIHITLQGASEMQRLTIARRLLKEK
jgi:hypothetical protein